MTRGTIRRQLTLWFAVQGIAGLGLICLAIYAIDAHSFSVRQQRHLAQYADIIRDWAAQSRTDSRDTSLRDKLDDFARAHDDTAVVLALGDRLLYDRTPSRAEPRWVWMQQTLPMAGDSGAASLRIGIDAREDDEQLRGLALSLVYVVLVGAMLISASGARLVRRGLRPLGALAAETASTGPAFPGRRIDASRYPGEMSPWIGQFNELLVRAEEAYRQLEAFNADVAHELRTPLANLITGMETELAHPRGAEQLLDAIEANLEDVRRLSSIVADMLFLSHADAGGVARRARRVDLAQEVHAVAAFHEIEMERAGLRIEVHGHADAKVDVPLVRRAISNLVGNAIRYATPGGAIEVVVEAVNDAEKALCWIRVRNRGEAIPPELLPLIFKRFFRAEASRPGSADHHGLGLAIVAAVARMHGGSTAARSADGWTEIAFAVAT